MRDVQSKAVFIATPTVSSAESTFAASFSKVDTSTDRYFDFADIFVIVGTHAINGTTIQSLSIVDSDTITSATSMATTAHTATIPAVTTLGLGGVLQFSMDLRKRKKYIGIKGTCGTTTHTFGVLAVLSGGASCDSTTTKKVSNIAATNPGVHSFTVV